MSSRLPHLARRTLSSRCAWSGAVVLAASALVACGGDKDATKNGSTPPPHETPPAPSAALVPGTATAEASSGTTASPPAEAAGIPKDANILVISIDSLRADRLLSHGYPEDVMPTVNAFEKSAASYSRFYAVSSYTSQSLGGFLAGRYPSELKRSGYFFGNYPDDETFFPEDLQKAGIRTVSAQAHFYFNKDKAGFHQGFDVWEIVPGLKKSNTSDENITSPQHTELALKELGDPANTKGRFFAWYHMLDPHDAYQKHPEGKDFGTKQPQLYDGEIYFTDMHVKKILDFVDAQPWGKKTVVIITADHGETFGEHKMYRHGFELWEVLTHVPLMIRGPGIKPRKIDEPRSMIDLAPTILDVFGVAPDPLFRGTSLVPELTGGDAKARDVITDLARTTDNDRRRTLLRGDWKIFELGDADGYQLFNVKDDPGEEKDLSKKEPAKFEEMKKALQDADKNIKEICPAHTEHLHGKKKTKPC